jgi:hypothetical protein
LNFTHTDLNLKFKFEKKRKEKKESHAPGPPLLIFGPLHSPTAWPDYPHARARSHLAGSFADQRGPVVIFFPFHLGRRTQNRSARLPDGSSPIHPMSSCPAFFLPAYKTESSSGPTTPWVPLPPIESPDGAMGQGNPPSPWHHGRRDSLASDCGCGWARTSSKFVVHASELGVAGSESRRGPPRRAVVESARSTALPGVSFSYLLIVAM